MLVFISTTAEVTLLHVHKSHECIGCMCRRAGAAAAVSFPLSVLARTDRAGHKSPHTSGGAAIGGGAVDASPQLIYHQSTKLYLMIRLCI